MPEPFVVRPVAAGAPASVPARGAATRVRRMHPALGPLAPYLDDPAVTDLFVNGATGLFVDRGAGPERAVHWRADEDQVRDLAIALISLGGRHIDDAKP